MENVNIRIVKRNGTSQAFAPNKIRTRIATQAKGLKVNVDELFIDIMPYVKDGITTTELDEITAFRAADKAILHPDYSLLGGRILMTRQAKIIGVDLEPVDYNYDFFAAFTFISKYSKKNEKKEALEVPSIMYERVSEHLHGGEKEYKELLLDELKVKKINFATPTYTNSGIPERNALISCNLTQLAGDSLEKIQDTLTHIAMGSKEGAGIGLLLDPIRSKKSLVGSFNNNAAGVTRACDMTQATMRFYKQGDRSGSCAPYLSTWHKDTMDFLELNLPVGVEELRARDLFIAVVIDDVFMNCLLNSTPYYLFCPNDIKKAGLKPLYECWGEEFKEVYDNAVSLGFGEEIDPKKIWDAIIRSQVESGRPYVFYKDNANKRNMQDNIGVIKQSNLCVSGDTVILTKDGYTPIKDLVGKEVDVWNGEEWSKTNIVKTGENQKLIRVETNSGHHLDCTLYHKFYIQSRYNKLSVVEKHAEELSVGDKLIKFELPIIEGTKDIKYAYTQGFYCGDGCNPNDKRENTHHVTLYGEKKKLLPLIDVRCKKVQSGAMQYLESSEKYLHEAKNGSIRCYLPEDIIKDKTFVPNAEYTIKTRIEWLAGLLDADGCVTDNDGSQSIQIVNVDSNFLHKVQLMLQTLGCVSKVVFAYPEQLRQLPKNDGTGESASYLCKATSRLLINGLSLHKLNNLGIKLIRLKISGKKPNRECAQFVKIKNIQELEGLHDTYCFKEEKRGMGMFNGILTGQCSEITNVSNTEYTSQCTLASINLAEQEDEESIAKSTKILVRALNKVIDKNKWSDDWSEKAGIDQRSIAIGVAGMADFFAKKKIAFESEEAKEWNERIFSTIYKAAVTESNRLAVEQNRTYPAWEGSRYSKGETYIEGWSPLAPGEPIPVLNSLFIGLMPTASSAILLSAFESFQPIDSNLFVRAVGQGQFIIINKHLVSDLEEIGLWNKDMIDKIVLNSGSIQSINEIPLEIRNRHKTVWEIPQKVLLDLAAIRNKYVDQSQSMNVYHSDVKYSKISSALVYAWRIGLKTGVYYTRTLDSRGENKKLSASEVKTKPKDSIFSCAGGGCDA